MKAPRGITTKFDGVRDGQAYFVVRATKFYLFKTTLRIARQNTRRPLLAAFIFAFAFYYLVVGAGDAEA